MAEYSNKSMIYGRDLNISMIYGRDLNISMIYGRNNWPFLVF